LCGPIASFFYLYSLFVTPFCIIPIISAYSAQVYNESFYRGRSSQPKYLSAGARVLYGGAGTRPLLGRRDQHLLSESDDASSFVGGASSAEDSDSGFTGRGGGRPKITNGGAASVIVEGSALGEVDEDTQPLLLENGEVDDESASASGSSKTYTRQASRVVERFPNAAANLNRGGKSGTRTRGGGGASSTREKTYATGDSSGGGPPTAIAQLADERDIRRFRRAPAVASTNKDLL